MLMVVMLRMLSISHCIVCYYILFWATMTHGIKMQISLFSSPSVVEVISNAAESEVGVLQLVCDLNWS